MKFKKIAEENIFWKYFYIRLGRIFCICVVYMCGIYVWYVCVVYVCGIYVWYILGYW
jgi:hypothetical protein